MTDAIPHAVYRVFNPQGELLYIGLSVNPPHRFKAHRRHSAWWAQADLTRTTMVWYDTRPEAARAELEAIAREKPRFNIVGSAYRGGRTVTALTDEQKAILANVVEEFDFARLCAAQAWESLIAARSAGIPDTTLCARAEVSRATLNRKLGPRRDIEESAA